MAKLSFYAFFVIIAIDLFINVSAKKFKDVAELQIGVLYRPDDCSTNSARQGDIIKIFYKGMLTDGTVFDSSQEKNNPYEFELYSGIVINGWDQGILGMCVGEKRRIKIPPKLAYGDEGSPPKIPGGATLIFDTELYSIEPRIDEAFYHDADL
ncbi:Peptidyl-prolyl cis-trans isomerase [Zostera marina]|uniref:peptidylprolyl isomerase n=1 Tax=Zostera marina TaxID=29655 RepID=A0A0K9PCY2_ZOSMR|nr:Peptidyl-prolyl cis-trans isomerase [Zostera marina]